MRRRHCREALREAVREGWRRPEGRHCAPSQVSVQEASRPATPATSHAPCARDNGTKKDKRVVTVASAHSSLAALRPALHRAASRSVHRTAESIESTLTAPQMRALGGESRSALLSPSTASVMATAFRCSTLTLIVREPRSSVRSFAENSYSHASPRPLSPVTLPAVTLCTSEWIDITPPYPAFLHFVTSITLGIPPLVQQQGAP